MAEVFVGTRTGANGGRWWLKSLLVHANDHPLQLIVYDESHNHNQSYPFGLFYLSILDYLGDYIGHYM